MINTLPATSKCIVQVHSPMACRNKLEVKPKDIKMNIESYALARNDFLDYFHTKINNLHKI